MNFNLIDLDQWDRKHYFEYYINQARCTFSMNANIDITHLREQLREKGSKFYPAYIYMVARIVNSHAEFRTCFDEQGRLGYWDELTPSFTIFHQDDRTFSAIWTEYSTDYDIFYQNYLEDVRQYGNIKSMTPKKGAPKNTFPISSIPWVSFTGININFFNEGTFLLPIVTCGKYFEQENKLLLPISLQAHHAVCDGYHAGHFLNELQRLADDCTEWLFVKERVV